MKQVLLVGVGGALGSILRYGVGLLASRFPSSLPLGTVMVNLAGCFLIGLAAALAHKRGLVTGDARLLLVTGFLGGFTTFSAFGLETLTLLQRGKYLHAAASVGVSVGGGLAMAWLGFALIAGGSKALSSG